MLSLFKHANYYHNFSFRVHSSYYLGAIANMQMFIMNLQLNITHSHLCLKYLAVKPYNKVPESMVQ